jgi:sensor domain DACNV-containing protein
MSAPPYPAARTYASRLADHFARRASEPPGAPGGPPPDAAAVEALIDAGFWASLQREEGYTPEISLAFLPPERAGRPLRLAAPLPLGPRALARLAPAVERPGIHLGVWRERDELVVWGTTRDIPISCFVLEVLGPGLLVVKHRFREDSAKFQNVAVFEGEQVKVLTYRAADISDHPALLRSLLAPGSDDASDDEVDLLLRLAVSMRAHKRGGALLVVPAGSEGWRRSIVRPIAYAVAPPFTELAALGHEPSDDGHTRACGEMGRVVDAVAGLTAVDGATLMTDRYELLAFGVKIQRPDGRPPVERVVVTEPVEGGVATVVAPVQLGGTRHISAAQFAQDQPDAIVLVASQDGRFTIFAWSEAEGMVHAHRVETLLV